MFLDSLSQKFVYTLLQLAWLYTFQGCHQLYISEYRPIYTLLVSSLLVTQLFLMFDSSLEHSSLLSWQFSISHYLEPHASFWDRYGVYFLEKGSV
jgi:hypothetical protein